MGRALKQRVRHILHSLDRESALDALARMPALQVVNPLFSFLKDREETMRWRAISAFGRVVGDLAEKDMEAARNILRRLMWNLNDESGGIGWGCAEAMGEILASHEGLAKEYAPILISYAARDGNFQEHELMQRGVLWGIARASENRPELLADAAPHAALLLNSLDPAVRALSARVLGLLGAKAYEGILRGLRDDQAFFEWFDGEQVVSCRVTDMATKALEKLDKGFFEPIIQNDKAFIPKNVK